MPNRRLLVFELPLQLPLSEEGESQGNSMIPDRRKRRRIFLQRASRRHVHRVPPFPKGISRPCRTEGCLLLNSPSNSPSPKRGGPRQESGDFKKLCREQATGLKRAGSSSLRSPKHVELRVDRRQELFVPALEALHSEHGGLVPDFGHDELSSKDRVLT